MPRRGLLSRFRLPGTRDFAPRCAKGRRYFARLKERSQGHPAATGLGVLKRAGCPTPGGSWRVQEG
jgi:hypothetical protein